VINLIPGDNTAGIVRGDFLARYPLDLVVAECSSRSIWIAGVGGLFSGYDGIRANGSLRFSNRVLGDFGGGSSIALLPILGCFPKHLECRRPDPRTTSCRSISARDSRFSLENKPSETGVQRSVNSMKWVFADFSPVTRFVQKWRSIDPKVAGKSCMTSSRLVL